MANIKYATILNAWVSTEGSMGMMTNYTYYSVLVAFTDGKKDIVEGKYDQIKYLLNYVQTPQDELIALKETVKDLRNDMNDIAEQKMTYVIDSLYPIPDIIGLDELEAEKKLLESCLQPVYVNFYDDSVPRIGKVKSLIRNKNNFKKIELNVVHEIPEVVGMSLDAASDILSEAGFTLKVNSILNTDGINNTVKDVRRDSDSSMELALDVNISLADLTGMSYEDALAEIERVNCTPQVYYEHSPKPFNTVIEWRDNHNGTVIVFFSKGMKNIDAKHVDVQSDTMQGSAGDDYKANVSCDFGAGTLTVVINANVNTKLKHKLQAIFCYENNSLLKSYSRSLPTLEAGTPGKFSVVIEKTYSREKLPRNIKIVMNTAYGLVKKEEDITLNLSIDW